MVLVFSSIFMGIWNSDQRAMDSTIARNKRLNKRVAVFPMPSVETIQRENMLPAEFSVPEPRPVRIAMRASDAVGQNEPAIERHEEQIHQHLVAKDSAVTLTPVSEELPASQNPNIEADAIPDDETLASKPRFSIVKANVPCTSSHARTQRLQTMHSVESKVK